jgi:cobalt-zinc-cadmium efflux system outer membrane protein
VQALQERRASLERTLDGLLDQAVPKSKGVLEATLGAVNRGGVSMTDLLLARRTHTDLLLKVMDLQFDLFAVRNDLRRALGLDADLARGSMTSSEVTP